MSNPTRYTGLVDRYRDRLPVSATTRAISLGEGNTPLIKLENIPGIIGKDVEIYVKYEGLNPTGSFKDRGMTMAVTKAVEEVLKRLFVHPQVTLQQLLQLMLHVQVLKHSF